MVRHEEKGNRAFTLVNHRWLQSCPYFVYRGAYDELYNAAHEATAQTFDFRTRSAIHDEKERVEECFRHGPGSQHPEPAVKGLYIRWRRAERL